MKPEGKIELPPMPPLGPNNDPEEAPQSIGDSPQAKLEDLRTSQNRPER